MFIIAKVSKFQGLNKDICDINIILICCSIQIWQDLTGNRKMGNTYYRNRTELLYLNSCKSKSGSMMHVISSLVWLAKHSNKKELLEARIILCKSITEPCLKHSWTSQNSFSLNISWIPKYKVSIMFLFLNFLMTFNSLWPKID